MRKPGGDTASKLTQKAVVITKDMSRALLGMAGKRGGFSVTNFAKHLLKKAVKILVKLIMKGLIKVALWLFGGTFGLILLLIVVVIIVFTGFFLTLDTNSNGQPDEEALQRVQYYKNWAEGTVDLSKPEQYYFRTNENLLNIASGIAEQKKENTGALVAKTIIDFTKPTFTYFKMDEYYETRVKVVKCDANGCSTTYSPESAPYPKTNYSVDKLRIATTFNGSWQLDYELKTGEWYEESSEYEGEGVTVTHLRRDTKQSLLRQYVTRADTSNLEKALDQLGFDSFDKQMLQTFYNTQSPDAFDIYFKGISDDQGEDTGSGERNGELRSEVKPTEEMLSYDWLWPVPSIKRISSPFGARFRSDKGVWEGHVGIDISLGQQLSAGHDVYASRDGIVTKAGKSSGYGIAVFIQHPDVKLITEYGHLQYDDITVKVGDHVKKGDRIASIGYGRVGDSTGPHLHFSIRDYKRSPLNPITFVHP